MKLMLIIPHARYVSDAVASAQSLEATCKLHGATESAIACGILGHYHGDALTGCHVLYGVGSDVASQGHGLDGSIVDVNVGC